MGKLNYSFEKRRKELAKKKKQQAKRQRKLEKKNDSVVKVPESKPDQDQEGDKAEVD